jgi:phage I-like protein
MLERLQCAIDLRSLAPEAVERSAPGAAPTAFRIWRAGENPTDKGPTNFTEKSARELIADQAARKNLFSIDVDHLSLSAVAPPEARKAVGWHTIEVRRDANGAPELWATGVEWTDVAKSGLEKDPPEWRYFSPAYDVDKKTREVTAYLNTALTNNPATWAVTALASQAIGGPMADEPKKMSKEDVLAALTAFANGTEEDIKKCAKAALAAFGQPAEPSKDEPAKDEPAKDEPAKDTSAPVAATASSGTGADDPVVALAAKVQSLEAKIAKDEDDKERSRLFASRPDFTPEVKKALEGKPLETLRFAVETFPRGAKGGAAGTATVTATRGAGQGEGSDGTDRTPRLSPEEKQKLDVRMGIKAESGAIRQADNRRFYGVMSPDEARKLASANGGAR